MSQLQTVVVLDEATADLVRAGANALIERGREEVLAQERMELAHEQAIEHERPPLALTADDVRDVTPSWLAKELVRRLVYKQAGVFVRSNGHGAALFALTRLTPDEIEECRALFHRITGRQRREEREEPRLDEPFDQPKP